VDILVQAQQQKPSDADIQDAKDFFRQHARSLLGSLTAAMIAKVWDRVIDCAIDSAWKALKGLIEKLKAKIGLAASQDAQKASGAGKPAAGLEQTTVQPADVPAQAASRPNPILVGLVEPFEILAQIFDPSDSASRTHPISVISEKLHCSEAEAVAILLRAGVFVEINPGVWGLDPHFGSHPPAIASDGV